MLFAVAFLTFLIIAALVLQDGALVDLDNRVQNALEAVRTSAAVKAASIFTQFGAIMVDTAITLSCVAFLIWRRELWRTITFLVAIYSLGAFAHAIKYLVDRQRPPPLEGFFDATPSFPSDHCAYSAALVMCIVILVVPIAVDPPWRKRVSVVLLTLPFLVALCRLLLSMHYLSDTIAGIAFGCAWVLLVVLFFQNLQKSGTS